MAIIPILHSGDMARSLAFYTGVLDFEQVGGDGSAPGPAFSVLARGPDRLYLSSHAGDGTPGQAVVVTVDDVDALLERLRGRGLDPAGGPDAGSEVHRRPTDQTWGTRELYVRDPDGNTIRFTQPS